MASPNEKIVRRLLEITNTCESVDEAIAAGMEELWDPEIEYVNPEDAMERGTRKGVAELRTVWENFLGGAGPVPTAELEELQERGDRVFTLLRFHMHGAASGIDVSGAPVGTVFTIRDERILRIEWHFDVDAARASFEQDD